MSDYESWNAFIRMVEEHPDEHIEGDPNQWELRRLLMLTGATVKGETRMDALKSIFSLTANWAEIIDNENDLQPAADSAIREEWERMTHNYRIPSEWSQIPDLKWVALLTSHVGEVGHQLYILNSPTVGSLARLREELLRVAATTAGWAVNIIYRKEGKKGMRRS